MPYVEKQFENFHLRKLQQFGANTFYNNLSIRQLRSCGWLLLPGI